MIIELITLAFLSMSPGPSLGGIYCDEIMEVLAEYQEETGAFSEEEMERFMVGCEGWEEEYEDDVEEGKQKPVEK